MIMPTVMEFKNSKEMEQNYMASSLMTNLKVMATRSMKIMMSMTGNGRIIADMEKECSKRHQLEELKEGFMKMIKS